MKSHRARQKDRRVAHAVGVASAYATGADEVALAYLRAAGISFGRFRGFRDVQVQVERVRKQLSPKPKR